MEVKAKTYTGDCLDLLLDMPRESVDLIYVDPPFFTQKVHNLATRDGSHSFSFRDIWDNDNSYADFVYQRVARMRDVLRGSGSIFFHCDKSASHIVRLMLDSVFSPENFRSEIIWYYKRWSNSKKGLLPAHQTIFFYSKTPDFKFKTAFQEYSPSTNIDQIMQKRARDERNKSVYARSDDGAIIGSGNKKGVPLSDVWEIPFLNPKAKERVGYPTQKPVLLLNQIIKLTTDEGDVVLDPFCGSGTTLVAAQLLKRNSIGIDISSEAIELTKDRLKNPVVTSSALLAKGADSYRQHDADASKHLVGIDYLPVHRNKGIDGLLKQELNGLPTFVRVQRDCETLHETIAAIQKAAKNKGACSLVVIATNSDLLGNSSSSDVLVIPSTALSLSGHLTASKKRNAALTG
ncbi:site-specific DNA-methyltransferase [Phaeobacter inhibens]|uniref:DNA-methyltransferase n=1 Tax=Phaeobacter inhibens TaxID=221822 RepID=UPI000401C0BC|nr:DNA methyltransferase [Phaeobacter inhibens]